MKTLRVELGERSYPIWVGSGALAEAGRLLARVGFKSPPIIVTNSTVLRMHGTALMQALERSFGPAAVITIPDGERFKNHSTLLKIYNGLFKARADRRSWVLTFGGGVVGDMAGFAAATFMRGIRYVQVPTTLLAQVDSSVGGKVGINVDQGKNLIGAFHQPSAVLSDTGVLRTLPSRELAAGLYEVVKCAAIRSEALLRFLERRVEDVLGCEPRALEHIVLEASRIKAEVVAGDETERGLRMILNYGHTIGHALEAATSYRRFKHGEAVAWGMIAALEFGGGMGLPDRVDVERLTRLIHRVEKLPPLEGISVKEAWSALKHDKKISNGSIRMVMLPRAGAAEVRSDIEPRRLRAFLSDFLNVRRSRPPAGNRS